MCKKIRVVLRSPENTTRVIIPKQLAIAPPPAKKNYSRLTLYMLTNKADDFVPEKLIKSLIKSFNLNIMSK